MTEIWIAAIAWVVTHLGLSSTPARAALVAKLGPNAFLGLYSLIAAATLGALIWAYGQAPRFDYLWLPNPDLYWVSKLTMPIACIFLLGGFMVPNPTMVGMTVEDDEQIVAMARGVTRITRHPFQWAVVIWSAGHIVANGDQVSIIFFSSIGIVSLAGTVLMDRKKAAAFGSVWAAYAGVTSNVPFAAILSGRNRLKWAELWVPIAAGLVLYAVFYWAHELITGAVIV